MDFVFNNQIILIFGIFMILIVNAIVKSNSFKKIFNFVFLLEGFTNSLVFSQKLPIAFSITIVLISGFFLFKILAEERTGSV